MASRTLLVVSARVDDAAREAVASGRWPRKDFFALASALDADVLDYGAVERHPVWRALRRVAGMPAAQAVAACTRSRRYDRIFSDGEHIGLPLAVMLRVVRHRPRHVTIGHLLTTSTKRAVFRWLRPERGLDAIILHASSQRRLAGQHLGLPPSLLPLAPYQIDDDFWAPRAAPTCDTISTVGLEYRDYPTLLAAVRGVPVRLVIAAGSRWSTHGHAAAGDLPPNVEVTTLDYPELRELYARSRFVVVPLHEVDNQAGITTILEGMAMGKAVIVSATAGQRDVVRGRLCTAAGPGNEPHGGPAAFGVTGALAGDETGLYVPPGDPVALRTAIQYLLDHPEEAACMGAAGRRLVAAEMNLDVFVRRVVALLENPPVTLAQR